MVLEANTVGQLNWRDITDSVPTPATATAAATASESYEFDHRASWEQIRDFFMREL